MTSQEVVINSYDAGQEPYIHDPKRGKWEGRWDFYLACITGAFSMRNFTIFGMLAYLPGGALAIVPLIISTLLYIIPIFFLQSFLGQFSSTGYITVFRISPLFKGIGYVILALNFSSLIYHSSIVAQPLLFFLGSFQLNTTWMYCDNSWNTPDCTEITNKTIFGEDRNITDSLDPLHEYYYRGILKTSMDPDTYNLSWTVILGTVFIWTAVGCIVVHGLRVIGKLLRYASPAVAVIFIILFIRICFLPEVGLDSATLFIPKKGTYIFEIFACAPVLVSSILGRGWGITLTMASFLPFKKNTEKYSFAIPFTMLGIAIILGYLILLVNRFASRRSVFIIFLNLHLYDVEYLFVTFPYLFGRIEASQMWSMLFYFALSVSELSSLVIQTFSVITALCDEYKTFRPWKRELTIGLCLVCCLLSMLFATNHIADAFNELVVTSYASQLLICFLEILVVVWIYGRERFLRDVRFMLDKPFSAWKFYTLRFATPIFIIFALLFYILTAYSTMKHKELYVRTVVLFVKVIPWMLIPGYIIGKLATTIGTIPMRLRKCTRPMDWYPADPMDRQKYEAAVGTLDISQQLLEMNGNNN